MTTTKRLLDGSKDIWEMYNAHPFVLGIQNGDLDREKFRFYIVQDYVYLQDYARTFAVGTSKATNPRTAALFSKYVNMLNGEIGRYAGCRFIENPDAPVLAGDYNNAAGGKTYASYIFGKDAFGIVDPEGGSMEMIVKDKSEIGGPLEQFSTIGYKFETNGATLLYPERVLRVMSCSSYSATDDTNYDADFYPG